MVVPSGQPQLSARRSEGVIDGAVSLQTAGRCNPAQGRLADLARVFRLFAGLAREFRIVR